jgi:chemotaxis protein CheY-P-specific phosphatase CheC
VTDTKLAVLLNEFNAIKDQAPNLAAIGFRTILSHLIQEQAKATKPKSEFAKKEDLFPSDAIKSATKEKFFQEAETKLIWNFEKNGQKAIFDNITHKPGANTLIDKSDLSSAVDMLNKLLPIVYPKGSA